VIHFTLRAKSGLYTASQGLSPIADSAKRKTDMDWDLKDEPLSASNVSLRLAEIQKRCSDLLSEPDSLDELTLEGEETALADHRGFNPYSRG
jgi:hypothetical protein